MKILEASGIYRENLSDVCMWDEKYNDGNDCECFLLSLLSSCFL